MIIPIEIPNAESMTDEEFFKFCAANKHLKIERDENHQIYIMPPAGLESDHQSYTLGLALGNWNDKWKAGICFGASAGFTLPDGSVRSPDAAWLSNEKWNRLSKEERRVFGHITPDFIVEVMSPSDHSGDMKKKMRKWMANGVRLGWLIEPRTQTTFIYKGD